jgi:regulator of protease activity HflC (stomatin/prohibitin superfamily)
VDGYTITSDGNIIHVRATIRYRITDPLAYVLNFVNAPKVMTNAVDNALFYVSGYFTAIGARQDQLAFKDMLMQRVRDLAEREHLGVRIETCDLRIIVPRQVQKVFEAVSDTEVLRRTTRDQAQTYAITNLSTAKGEADAIINEGKSEATRLLQQVASEAKYFTNQLANYQENPALFRERLSAEAMSRILTNVPVVFSIPPAAAGQEPEVRLLLNAPPRRPPPQPDESAVPRR